MKKSWILILITIIIISGCSNNGKQTIGGQRDEHGCLGPAGYSWDKYIGACSRHWEITDVNELDAVKIAVESLSDKEGLTVTSVETLKCPGCFTISLTDINSNQYMIKLSNWEIQDSEKPSTISNFEECVESGYPIMESYPRQCNDGENTYTENTVICDDLCGDSICQEIVCQGTGCPCAETTENCPVDCS